MGANLKSSNLLGKAGETLDITTSMENMEREVTIPKSIYTPSSSPLPMENTGDVTVSVT